MGSITPIKPQPPYPLHPTIRPKLDPEYVTFYNKHITHQQQVHLQPIHVSPSSGILIPGGGPKLPVGKTEDLYLHRRETEGPDIPIRVFTPGGKRPERGWPGMVYFRGGGWVLGNIETENTVCTNICARANCVVITIDYRLAPENPYPAAVYDCWETLLWLRSTGTNLLSLNPSKIAIGGSSAGGNLAAIMCHKSLCSPTLVPKFLLQILLVPVTDNTASPLTHASWRENKFSPALPAEKMLWFRKHYLLDERRWGEEEASPLLYEGGWEEQPRALVVVGELDVLRSEGEAYAEKLRGGGVEVDLKVMRGMPHPFLAMDGVLRQGRETIGFMVEALMEIFA